MEIDFKLTKAQQAELDHLHKVAGEKASFSLARIEGTGVKYWRITLNNGYEWSGSETVEREAKQFNILIHRAHTVLANWQHPTDFNKAVR